VFQIVHGQRRQHVDHGFSHDLVDQGLAGGSIDDGEHARDQHDFRDYESGPRGAGDGGHLDPVLPQHQRPEEDDEVKGDEEEDRRRDGGGEYFLLAR